MVLPPSAACESPVVSYGVCGARLHAFGIPHGGRLGQRQVVFLQGHEVAPRPVAFRRRRDSPSVHWCSAWCYTQSSPFDLRDATALGSLRPKGCQCPKPGLTTNKATFTFPMVALGAASFFLAGENLLDECEAARPA